MYFTGECHDIQFEPFEVYFPNGTSTAKFTVNITDDDFYEFDEVANFVIVNDFPDRVLRGTSTTTSVTIKNDEKSKQFL